MKDLCQYLPRRTYHRTLFTKRYDEEDIRIYVDILPRLTYHSTRTTQTPGGSHKETHPVAVASATGGTAALLLRLLLVATIFRTRIGELDEEAVALGAVRRACAVEGVDCLKR